MDLLSDLPTQHIWNQTILRTLKNILRPKKGHRADTVSQLSACDDRYGDDHYNRSKLPSGDHYVLHIDVTNKVSDVQPYC